MCLRFTILVLAVTLAHLVILSPARAGETRCFQCHLRGEFSATPGWTFRFAETQDQGRNCPGLSIFRDQAFLTETRLESLESWVLKLDGSGGRYHRAWRDLRSEYLGWLSEPLTDAGLFAKRASGLRGRLDKEVFRPLEARETRRRWLIGLGLFLIMTLPPAALVRFKYHRRRPAFSGPNRDEPA
ncbi:MAG: hypothetical protein AB1641_26395 [Thermodesulfobacteriota bacterium]